MDTVPPPTNTRAADIDLGGHLVRLLDPLRLPKGGLLREPDDWPAEEGPQPGN